MRAMRASETGDDIFCTQSNPRRLLVSIGRGERDQPDETEGRDRRLIPRRASRRECNASAAPERPKCSGYFSSGPRGESKRNCSDLMHSSDEPSLRRKHAKKEDRDEEYEPGLVTDWTSIEGNWNWLMRGLSALSSHLIVSERES